MKFTHKLFAYRFFSDFMVLYPFFVLYLNDLDFSSLQISVLLLVWSSTVLLMEVPSGAWADRYSRKTILIIGEVIRGLGWLIWLLAPTFVGFLMGFVAWGIKNALVSGTFQAYVYDELKDTKREESYAKVIGTSEAVSLIAIVASTLLSSFVITAGYPAVINFSLLSLVLATGCLFLLPEPKTRHKALNYLTILKEGVSQAITNSSLRVIILYGAFLGAFFGGLGNFTTLFINDIGWSAQAVPIIYAGITILLAVASFIAYKFINVSFRSTSALITVSGVMLMVAGFMAELSAIIFIAAYMFMFKAGFVIYDAKLQQLLPSHLRATVTSVKNLTVEFLNLGIYLVFGFIAVATTRPMAFGYFGIIIITFSLISMPIIKSFTNKGVLRRY